MVLPLRLMPKFVYLVMKKSYHLQEVTGAGKNCQEELFFKENNKITMPNIFENVYFTASAANWKRGPVKFTWYRNIAQCLTAE